jgi:ABC-type transporter Mla subunit MlaD
MPVTDQQFAELEGRVTALEQAQNDNTQSLRWLIKTLAQMQKTVDQHSTILDDHTSRLNRVEKVLDDHTSRLNRVEKKLDDHVRTFPAIVADTMREVLKEQR